MKKAEKSSTSKKTKEEREKIRITLANLAEKGRILRVKEWKRECIKGEVK